MRISKVSELKIGDKISWAKRVPRPYVPRKDGEGTVVDKKGRNIGVEQYGEFDWVYFPSLAWVEVDR